MCIYGGVYSGIVWEKNMVVTFCFVSNKVWEESLKILHRCCPVNSIIVKFRPNVDPLCSFCPLENETAIHLFRDCTFSQTFWYDLNLFLNGKLDLHFKINFELILFGLFDDKIPIKKVYVINLISPTWTH